MDYYNILGVNKTSSPHEIKKAYKDLALIYHPDKSINILKKKENEEKFKMINKAYETLSNQEKRKQYDLSFQNNIFNQMNIDMMNNMQNMMFNMQNMVNNMQNMMNNVNGEDIVITNVNNVNGIITKETIIRKNGQTTIIRE